MNQLNRTQEVLYLDYQSLHMVGNDTVLHGVRYFHLPDILDCGQCFRWQPVSAEGYRGTVAGKTRTVIQQGNELIFCGVSQREFDGLWRSYFDLDRDYHTVQQVLCRDNVMARAVSFTPGMRVLRQDPWETLCSFIISANNNIVRIRGIVERLCEQFGEPADGGGFAFPTASRLAELTEQELAPIRCGYRARYLLDAAHRVANGSLNLELPYTLPLSEARAYLRQVQGVGPKVAECILLYGYSRTECVPVDVWIRRALDTLYPSGMPLELSPVAGLGQQYLFHYVRRCPDALQSA